MSTAPVDASQEAKTCLNPQRDESAFKITVIPAQGQSRAFPYSRGQNQPDERGGVLIWLRVKRLQVSYHLLAGKVFGLMVVHFGKGEMQT
jgi:hypothetical protein